MFSKTDRPLIKLGALKEKLCQVCNGAGKLISLWFNGKAHKTKCYLCHGTGKALK
jgi:DnaJ-class molecular chaperone